MTPRGAAELWVGTEDKGVWRYTDWDKKWTQFSTKNGLGDDHIYALATDPKGRVWAGHLNHGVSVWNGEQWKNYGLLEGPLGDRVFDIAVCPADGDVWIASDCGAARYSQARDDWDYYTCASGLPSNQIQAIAFSKNGDVSLETQSNGSAAAKRADNYATWTRDAQNPGTPAAAPAVELKGNAPLPSPAKTPDEDSLAKIASYLTALTQPLKTGDAGYIGDDWRTEGDWMGRYGQSLAWLCAESEPAALTADARYKVKAASATPAPAPEAGALYNPLTGAPVKNGITSKGDLLLNAEVPEGVHCVSLYFQDSSADHASSYDVQVRPPGAAPDARPVKQARLSGFARGVYKQFVVCGPGEFSFVIHANAGTAAVQGMFIDQLTGDEPPEKKTIEALAGTDFTLKEPTDAEEGMQEGIKATALLTWATLDSLWDKHSGIDVQLPFRLWIYRCAAAQSAPPTLLAYWREQIGLWTSEEREEFKKAAAAAWSAYSKTLPAASD